MKKRLIDEILIHETDLWPGATRSNVLVVVKALQDRGWNALRARKSPLATVGEPLRFAADYYDVVLDAIKVATARAEKQAKDRVVKTLIQERARLERAQAERDRCQAEVERIAARLEELTAAAEQFDRRVSATEDPAGD